jgi:hypothetical protein
MQLYRRYQCADGRGYLVAQYRGHDQFRRSGHALYFIDMIRNSQGAVRYAPSQAKWTPPMRKHSNRPIVERLMPNIGVKQIASLIPRDNPNAIYQLNAFGIGYNGAKIEVSTHAIKVNHQQFRIKWIPTYFGRHRPLLICSCGRATCYLYNLHGQYSCRKCCNAIYLCQKQSRLGRKLLTAAKLRIKLGGLPSRLDTIAPKAPGKHRKQYYQARDHIEHLEMKARRSRLKPFDTRYFAYHIT